MKNYKFLSVLAVGVLAMSMAACKTAEKPAETVTPEATAETEVEDNKAAIVGSWQLSKVLVSETEGEDPKEVQEADHASMFGEKDNVYTFNEDGTGTYEVVAGPDKTETEVTWTTNPEGSFAVTAADGSVEETYLYDPVEDVLMREFIGSDPYTHVVTVFARK